MTDANTWENLIRPKPGDNSLWDTAEEILVYADPEKPRNKKQVKLLSGPRGYLRIIPSGWENRPPRPKELNTIRELLCMWPSRYYPVTDDFGATQDGYIYFGIAGTSEPGLPETTDLVKYFSSTGEFWVLTGKPFKTENGKTFFSQNQLSQDWLITLDNILDIYKYNGALRPIKVKAGLVNLSGVHYHDIHGSNHTPPREREFEFEDERMTWKYEELIEFSLRLHNLVGGHFFVPPVTLAAYDHAIIAPVQTMQRYAEKKRLQGWRTT